jgi:hypothetical protein
MAGGIKRGEGMMAKDETRTKRWRERNYYFTVSATKWRAKEILHGPLFWKINFSAVLRFRDVLDSVLPNLRKYPKHT